MEFAEQIMVDLINQGYRGSDLREHFKEEVGRIHLAVKAMLEEAARAAASKAEYSFYGDVFDRLEASQGILAEREDPAKERGWLTADEMEVELRHD